MTKSLLQALLVSVAVLTAAGSSAAAEKATGYPTPAGSWGGVVRAGPGQEFARLASLAEGEKVVLIEKSKVTWNGYPWLKIRFRGKKEGYQWGGILCALGTPSPDVYEVCPK